MARFAKDIVSSCTGYYGNEASQTDFYTHAAIIVTIPEAEGREAIILEDLSVEKIVGVKRSLESSEEELDEFQAKLSGAMKLPGGATVTAATMTVPELKDACRARGLKVGGSKGVLLERLLNADNNSA
jgi:hypothetical protein